MAQTSGPNMPSVAVSAIVPLLARRRHPRLGTAGMAVVDGNEHVDGKSTACSHAESSKRTLGVARWIGTLRSSSRSFPRSSIAPSPPASIP